MKNICVIGTGYVGLVTGTCFADLGNTVVCVDINEEKIAMLNAGKMPIYEPGLEEMVERNVRAGRLSFATSYSEGLGDASFVFIAVGTPSGVDGEADLRYVRMAAEEIARTMTEPLIIINKSTVPVGTGDWVADIVSRNQPKPIDFAVVSNPEFLREGNALADFLNPDRVVLGSLSKEAAEKVAQLHLALRAPIVVTDLRTAEMIKYASNAFLATRISFINEIAAICEELGADVKEVAAGMGYDKRIGKYFLDAGLGYGGSCFTADTTVFVLNGHQVVARPFASLAPGNAPANQDAVEVFDPGPVKQVLAFDLDRKHSTLADVSCVTRRWYEGPVVTLKTRMGRRLRVTADHPVVRYDATTDGMVVLLAQQVRPGDKLIAVTALPELDQVSRVNLIEKLGGTDLERWIKVRPIDDSFKRRFAEYGHAIPSELLRHKHEIKRTNCLSLALYRHLDQQGLLDEPVQNLRLFTTKGQPTHCPAEFLVDADFMRLLGYYAAEGWIGTDFGRNGQSRDRVGFSFDTLEEEYVADLHSILRRYGIRFLENKVGRSHSTIISSKPLAFLLRTVLACGTRSEDKAIPKLAFHVSDDLKLAFLQGAWSGDGAVTQVQHGRNLMYEYATVSKPLAEGMALLLQSLGVVPSIRDRWMNKSKQPAYLLRISGIAQMQQLQGLFGASRQQEIAQRLQGYERRIAQSGFVRKDGFVTLEVSEVRMERAAEYVYSMETATGTLLTASGLVAHNCFPKDVLALEHMALVHGTHPSLLRAVMDINRDQRRKVIHRLRQELGRLQDKTVGLLGLAFKPNTDDMREAAAVEIGHLLQNEGAHIKGYDPVSMHVAAKELPEMQLAEDAYDLAEGCDAIVVCTEWNEFRHLDLERIRRAMRFPVIYDGRNIYDPEHMARLGFRYYAVGRSHRHNGGKKVTITPALPSGT